MFIISSIVVLFCFCFFVFFFPYGAFEYIYTEFAPYKFLKLN